MVYRNGGGEAGGGGAPHTAATHRHHTATLSPHHRRPIPKPSNFRPDRLSAGKKSGKEKRLAREKKKGPLGHVGMLE